MIQFACTCSPALGPAGSCGRRGKQQADKIEIYAPGLAVCHDAGTTEA